MGGASSYWAVEGGVKKEKNKKGPRERKDQGDGGKSRMAKSEFGCFVSLFFVSSRRETYTARHYKDNE